MNSRAKLMLIASIILLGILVIKSLWIDPVGSLEGDYLKYKNYALGVAPHQPGLLIFKESAFVKYQVISVKKISEEGRTTIVYSSQGGNQIEEELEGHYEAKVRAYLLSFLPFTDVKIKGGE